MWPSLCCFGSAQIFQGEPGTLLFFLPKPEREEKLIRLRWTVQIGSLGPGGGESTESNLTHNSSRSAQGKQDATEENRKNRLTEWRGEKYCTFQKKKFRLSIRQVNSG